MNVRATQEEETTGSGGILSAIGGAIGLMMGGPTGAALGSGLGSLASGGSFQDASDKTGLMNYGHRRSARRPSLYGAECLGLKCSVGGGGQSNPMAAMFAVVALAGGGQSKPSGHDVWGAGGWRSRCHEHRASTSPTKRRGPEPAQAQTGGLGPFLSGMAKNPLVMASLIEAFQPKGSMMSPLQQQQMATGERLPNYRGTAAPDFRYGGANPSMQRFAMGGFIEGPGTGTSDSIPAKIYQNGGPVQEAMLSDGEFVMTADAVRGAGGGDRGAGAAKMYEMMNRLERRA
jgi:hypothetical protein